MNSSKNAGWLQDDNGNTSSGRIISVFLVAVGVCFLGASTVLSGVKADKASEAGYYCVGVGVFGRIAGKGVEKLGNGKPKSEELP